MAIPLATPSSAAAASKTSQTSGGGSWPTYQGNVERTGYTTDPSITAQNAAQLHQTWQTSVKAPISAQPIVDDGVVYWADWNGVLHAASSSGKPMWTTSLGTTPRPKGCPFKLATQGILSTPTMGKIGGRTVLWVGGGNGNMVAVAASNGRVIWQTPLRTALGLSIWSSPAYYNGSIYVATASFQDCPLQFGQVVRLNAATGAIQAAFKFKSILPAKCKGPGVWSSPSIDPSEGAVFISTSNDSCNSKFQDAIVKLNASTMRSTSVWQIPPSQSVPDSDFGGTPMLFSATIGGVARQLVGAVNKNGIYYALDRDNLAAGPVWTYTAARSSAIASEACGNTDAISTSAWAGPGSPVMVAGLNNVGYKCVGTIAALNPSSGQPEWQTTLPGSIEGSVTEVPGVVAVGAGATVDLLSSATGQVLYKYSEATKPQPKGVIYGAPSGEFWAPPTISGNSLYAANQDGSFRAFSP